MKVPDGRVRPSESVTVRSTLRLNETRKISRRMTGTRYLPLAMKRMRTSSEEFVVQSTYAEDDDLASEIP